MKTRDNDEYRDMLEESNELEEMLYARHVEITSLQDLEQQRGTPIPALFNQFYKFIQNPSSVSVETMKRMVDTDDTIGSGVDFLTTCLAARLGRFTHNNPEISTFVNKALDKIEGGFYNSVKELLSASWAGFSVQEKVWENHEMGFIVKKLVTLPPSTILFETERTGELTSDGILQYQRNYNPALLGMGANYLFGFSGMAYFASGGIPTRPDALAKFGDLPFPIRAANTYNYLSIRIPKQKAIHYSFDAQGKFGNPYGRSLLRRCYHFYVAKHKIIQMWLIALDRKGTPLTVVFSDPNTTVMDAEKYDATNKKGNREVGVPAQVAAAKAFQNIHNDSTIFLPGKRGEIFDIEKIDQNSNAHDFIDSIRECNVGIMRALLLPPLVFSSGDGAGSYSLGQEHSRTFDKVCDGLLEGVKHVLIQQLISELIRYNFPEKMWKEDGFGEFAGRELTDEERSKEVEALERALNMGALDMNDIDDKNAVRTKVGLKAMEEDTDVQDDVNGDMDGVSIDPAMNPGGTPNAPGQAVATTAVDNALNGAQVTSLLEVISNVSSGGLTQNAAREIIQSAFPQIPVERVQRILADIKTGANINVNDNQDLQPKPKAEDAADND